jgi:hypothetical protein
MSLRGVDGGGKGGDVVRPIVAAAFNEERRRPGDPAEVRALDVLGDALRPKTRVEVAGEALHVQAEPLGIADEVRGLERVLMGDRRSCMGQNASWAAAASAASAAGSAWMCTSESGRCRHT